MQRAFTPTPTAQMRAFRRAHSLPMMAPAGPRAAFRISGSLSAQADLHSPARPFSTAHRSARQRPAAATDPGAPVCSLPRRTPPPPYSCPYPCSYCTLPRLTTTSPPARVPTGEQRTARIALHIAPGRQPTHLPCGRTRRRVILSLRVEVAELIAARRARPSRFQSTGAAPRSGEGAAPQLGRELDAQPLLPCARAATPPHPPGPAG